MNLQIPIESLELDLQGIEQELNQLLPIECANDAKFKNLNEARKQTIHAIKKLKS
jgi:hypothetical protein